MITRYNAWIDGVGLQDIDPEIYIMDIEESAPAVEVIAVGRAGRAQGRE